MRRDLGLTFLEIALCGLSAMAQQSAATVPAQAPQVTLQGPQRQQPPGHQQPIGGPSSRTAQAPSTSIHAPYLGTLLGYVYWDTNTVQHNPPISCSGLTVTISVGTPPSGSTPAFEQFKPLGTYNTFTYLNNGSSLGVCAYAVHQMPVGQDLQVQASVTTAISFSPFPGPSAPVSPIKITGGLCTTLAPAVPSPSVLTAKWWTCGNSAYNVNFVLQAPGANHLMGASGQGLLLGRPAGQPAASNPGPNGMLTGRSMPAVQSQGSSGSIQGNRQQMLSANPGQKALTTADVVKMVNSGVPESVIVSSIRSGARNFNLGPDGCSDLRRARVSLKVLDAMGDGSKRPCSTGLRAATKLTPPKQTNKITNAKTRQQQAEIIAVLQKQRTAADAEAVQMKLAIRPAAIQVQPSQTMAATGSGRMANSPAAVQPATLAGSNAANSQSGTARFAVAPFFNTLALTCAHDPTMRVLTVSGGPSPVVFTPDPKYNFYTITGCSFGNPGTNSKAYIYYQGTFREDFQIQQWTDNSIQLSLDPNTSGVDDQSNVTFLIQREDGTQAAKNGYSFYAVRQTVLLPQIPRTYFSLDQFRTDNSILSGWNPTYTSGSSASVIPNLPGLSAEVHWDITYDTDGSLTGGSDIYDFSHLHSTFALDSASMEWANVSCGDPSHSQFTASNNNWSIDWYGPSGVQVGWQGQVCKNTPGSCGGGPFVTNDCFANAPESNYGVNVWVNGPRGLDPWTGKPLS
jgi:hypothetical protein